MHLIGLLAQLIDRSVRRSEILERWTIQGVPPDLPVASFIGHHFEVVRLGAHYIELDGPGGSIYIEGTWHLTDAESQLIDGSADKLIGECFRLHVILQEHVVATRVDAPEGFVLVFEDGSCLSVFADSHRESFALRAAGGPTIRA